MRTSTVLLLTALLALACGGPAADPWETPLGVVRDAGPTPPARLCASPSEQGVCAKLGQPYEIDDVLTPDSAGCACELDVRSGELDIDLGRTNLKLGGGERTLVITPLYWAASAGRGELVGPLIEAGAHPNQRNPGELDERRPIGIPAGRVPLDPAISGSHVEVVRVLLEHGADLEQAQVGLANPTMLGWLLENGLSPQQARVPLLFDPEDVPMLLDAGLPPDASDEHGMPWLHAAVGQPGSVRLLLEAGADPNLRDEDGYTALHRAARQRGPAAERAMESVRLLIEAGADPKIRNQSGRVPSSYASDGSAMEKLLSGAGG